MTGPGEAAQVVHPVGAGSGAESLSPNILANEHRAPDDRDSIYVQIGRRAEDRGTEATGQVEMDVPCDRDGSFERKTGRGNANAAYRREESSFPSMRKGRRPCSSWLTRDQQG